LNHIRGTNASELRAFARFLAGLPRFLRTPISIDQAEQTIRCNARNREQRLIDKLDAAVFSYSRSPYRVLFELGRWSRARAVAHIRANGVEAALEDFRKTGVYVSWDEFKGRAVARRNGETYRFKPEDFDNPVTRPSLSTSSSGSSGVPVRVGNDLDDNTQSCVDWAVLFRAWGLEDSPLIFWTADYAGMAIRYLKCSKFGKDFERWFISSLVTKPGERFRARLVHGYTRLWAGYRKPEPAPLHDCEPVLRCLLDFTAQGKKPIINCTPSGALELSRRAVGRGVSLQGVHFLLGAEPLSPARKAGIVASGAITIPTYGTSEGGWIGAQFPGAEHADGISVFRDAYAIIAEPDEGLQDSAPMLLTNLRPAGPKVLLNTGIGDSARFFEDTPSGYARSLGFTQYLHCIRSFRKVTVFGSTFALADLAVLLEDILPRHCGGGPGDYQLVETEEEGAAQLVLRVNPEIPAPKSDKIRRVFLSELEKMQHFYHPMTWVLEKTASLRVVREKPRTGPSGKLSPVITQS